MAISVGRRCGAWNRPCASVGMPEIDDRAGSNLPDRDAGGFTILELLVVIAVIGIIAAIAVPGLISARNNSREAAAVTSMRAVLAAQSTYALSCGGGFFAPSLVRLGTQPADGSRSFVDADLASDPAVKSGFALSLTPGAPVADSPASCNGAAAGSGVRTYWLAGDPVQAGGGRYFGGNQGGTLYEATAPIAPTQTGAPPGAVPFD